MTKHLGYFSERFPPSTTLEDSSVTWLCPYYSPNHSVHTNLEREATDTGNAFKSKKTETHLFLKNVFIDYAITVVSFPPLYSPPPCAPPPTHSPPFSSCPWVIYISSLASTFPILFLPSPCLFSTYRLCYLFSVPFPLSPPPNPLLITLHAISISVVLFLF